MARERADVGTYEDIVAAAVRSTGMSDFGGDDHEEGLRRLVDDLNSPAAGLTGVGNYQMRAEVKSALVGRLLAQSGFNENPGYADVRIERPVFVLGLTRSGTTALHRLLTADARHQGLEAWIAEFPQPRPPRETWDSNPVFTGIQAAYQAYNEARPDYAGIHFIDAAAVEECWRLLRQGGTSIGYESLAHVPNYSAWLAEHDWTHSYERYKANLQLIGLNDQEKRWVLKNPSHLVALDELMAVFPDALIVQTHRDPVVSVASSCSLTSATTEGWSTTFVGEAIGKAQLELLTRELRVFKAAREKYDASQFFDVQYQDFVADPVGTVASIYEAFDLGWNDEVATAVTASHEESKKEHRKPSHRYTLADYGLTEEQVREAFTF